MNANDTASWDINHDQENSRSQRRKENLLAFARKTSKIELDQIQ